ncbi:MAG: GNAT family N-acetyltransferase [Candidatus Bruticola sp.]
MLNKKHGKKINWRGYFWCAQMKETEFIPDYPLPSRFDRSAKSDRGLPCCGTGQSAENDELGEIKICRAEKKDLPEIINISAASVGSSMSPLRRKNVLLASRIRREDMRNLNWQIASDVVAVFVAKNEMGRVVGHIVANLDVTDFLTGEKQAWIFDLAVKPEYRRRGIGNRLIEAVEASALEKGLTHIGFTVTCANTGAVNFYKEAGYQDERVQMVKILQ